MNCTHGSDGNFLEQLDDLLEVLHFWAGMKKKLFHLHKIAISICCQVAPSLQVAFHEAGNFAVRLRPSVALSYP